MLAFFEFIVLVAACAAAATAIGIWWLKRKFRNRR